MIVYPGVLVHSKEEFSARLEEIKGISDDGIHIDIADGHYVHTTLLPVEEMGILPENCFFEAHLMVNNPVGYFEKCKQAGFNRVLVHFDSLGLETYAQALLVQQQAHKLGLEFGLVFTHDNPVELHADLCNFDQILVMTIIPGGSGLPFIPEQVEEVRKIRAYCPDISIKVDGHVNDETITVLKAAGATEVVGTSYLSGKDIIAHYQRLKGV